MKRKISYLLVCALVATAIFSAPFVINASGGNSDSGYTAYAAASSDELKAPSGVKAEKASATSLKISWKKVKNANGYVVYKYDSKSKKYKKAKTITKASTTNWTSKKLKTGKTYKYKVCAYTKVNGKEEYGANSYAVSAVPHKNDAKKVNVKKVEVGYANRYLGLNMMSNPRASVAVAKDKKPLSKKLIYTSSDKSVVKVTSSGYLKAQGKSGKAKVYIRAHNGITKTLNITVKDYANPKSFINLDKVKKINKNAAAIYSKYKPEICRVATQLEQYAASPSVKTSFFYDEYGLQADGDEVEIGPIEQDLIKLTKDADMYITIGYGWVLFSQRLKPGEDFGPEIWYSDYNGNVDLKIAPCWHFQCALGV
jgi:hypothetical protein